MRKLLLLLMLLGPCFSWATVEFNDLSITQAKQQATAESKNIFVSYTATWCLPCQLIEERVYSDPDVQNILNKEFVSVKADIDSPSGKWFDSYDVHCLPTLSILDKDGLELSRIEGTMSLKEILAVLNTYRTQPFDGKPILDDSEINNEKIVSSTALNTSKVVYLKTASGATTTLAALEGKVKASNIVNTVPSNDAPNLIELKKKSSAPAKRKTKVAKKKITKKPKKQTPSKRARTFVQSDYYVLFGSFESEEKAENRRSEIIQRIDKNFEIEAQKDKYQLVSVDFESISEARTFLVDQRSKGISCFLLRK